MGWEFDAGRPIYAQLAEVIRGRIISGTYQPGDRLPSVRDLADEAGVNPNTMQRALAELERQGLVHSVRTSGRFITIEQSVLSEAREESAKEITRSYLNQMEALGYDRAAILNLMTEIEL